MSDNNTNPEMKKLELNDDALEKVAGGRQDIYIVKATKMVPVYGKPKIWPTLDSEPVGEVYPGVTLNHVEAHCGYPGWLMVPIIVNANKLVSFNHEAFKNHTEVYIDGKYLDLKKKL